jgi:NTE family protein
MADMFLRKSLFRDYTFPAVSLLRGQKIAKALAYAFNSMEIEDMWLPFFCVSSNLTKGRVEIHLRGQAKHALMASIAIPGLLPPVIDGKGDVLVDGAMMNNLPIDIMANLGRGSVIGVDVARDLALDTLVGTRSPSRLLSIRRLFRVPNNAPPIASILMRSATVSSDAQVEANRARASLIIQPSLASIGLMSWRSLERAAEIGYSHTQKLITTGAIIGSSHRG